MCHIFSIWLGPSGHSLLKPSDGAFLGEVCVGEISFYKMLKQAYKMFSRIVLKLKPKQEKKKR